MGHEHIFLAAKEFFDAYLILYENNEYVRTEIAKSNPFNLSPEARRRLNSGELKRTSIPDVICLSFSIELYLKGLIVKLTGNPPRKHLLNDLFLLLPGNTKTAIIKNTEMNFGKSMSELEFMDSLAGISNAFVEWRYLHEKEFGSFLPMFSVSFIRAIVAEAES